MCVCVRACMLSRTTCSTVHPERRMRASSKSGGSTDRHTHCSALYGYRHTYACINTHYLKTLIYINTTWVHVHITSAIQTHHYTTHHNATHNVSCLHTMLCWTHHICTTYIRGGGGGGIKLSLHITVLTLLRQEQMELMHPIVVPLLQSPRSSTEHCSPPRRFVYTRMRERHSHTLTRR